MKLDFLKKKILGNKEVKNAGWLIGGKVVQMLLSLVVGALSARYLGPSNYGLVGYGTTFVSFFSSFCTLGLNSVIIKDFIDHPDEEGEALGSSIALRIISSLASSVMIIGIVSVLDRGEPLTIAVVALSSASLVFHAFNSINYWFQKQYKSKITAIATFIAYAATSAYKIILLILGMDVKWFAFANSVDYIVLSVFLLLAYKKHNGPAMSFSWEKGKSLLGRSYHYILSGMMVAIYGHTDKFMLKQMLDEAAVGYYTVGMVICNMWVFVLIAIIDSIHPTIMTLHKTDKAAYERKNRQLFAIVFYASVFVSLMICLFGDLAIYILYGEAYKPAAAPLKIITWYTAFSYLGAARNAWIVCENKQKYLKYMYGGAAFSNVLFNVLFIPWLGASGAALASLLTQVLSSIVLPYCIKDLRPSAKLMLEAIFLKDLWSKSGKKTR
ncbi:MAG: flippase [Ruminococcaceae bacterium]|nr:flippase [Oscillospiraceae bacterium]